MRQTVERVLGGVSAVVAVLHHVDEPFTGFAGDAHLPTEWYENVDGPLGVVRALLVTAAMAEVR